MARSNRTATALTWFLLTVAVFGLLFVAQLSYMYFSSQRDQLKTLAQNDLMAIMNLKVNQIGDWLDERRNDAAIIHDNSIFFDPLFAWLAGQRTPTREKEIKNWMASLCGNTLYSGIFLLDSRSRTTIYFLKHGEEGFEVEEREAAEALLHGKTIIGDIQQDRRGKVKIDIYLPITDKKQSGILVLRINPDLYLYPLIQTWPVPSRSAETLLVRPEGDEVVFLNELRHQKGTALKLRLPRGKRYLPASLVVMGARGLIEGKDYRGVPVLAVGRPIPGTNWYLVAKVDESEIFLPMVWIGVRASAIGTLVIILISILAYLIISRQATQALKESRDAFQRLVSASPDAVIATDLDGAITYASEQALELCCARGKGGHINDNFLDLVTARDRAAAQADLRKALATGLLKGLEYTFLRLDGGQFLGQLNAAVTKTAGGRPHGLIVTLRDITNQKAMERIISDSAVRFQSLFDNMSSGVVIYLHRQDGGDEFIIADINRAALRIEKVEKEAVIGRDLHEAFPGAKEMGMFDALLRVWQTGTPEHLPIAFYQDQRISGWRENYIYKLPSGEVVAVYDDVTVRKQAEEQLNRQYYYLQKSQELALVGSWDLDIGKNVLAWTDETYRIFEVRPGTPLSFEKFLEFIHPDDRELVEKAWQAALLHWDYDVEHRIVTDSGVKWVREKAKLQHDGHGKAVRAIGAVVDITEYKRLVNLRDDFVNTVSHELRTPMAIIHEGVAQVIEGIHGPVNEEQSRFLSTTLRSIDRLGRIINDLLDISRLESGRMTAKKEPIDFGQLAREVAAVFRPRIEKKNLEFVLRLPEGPVNLCADRDEMTEVLTNLLGNALKFTEQGRIELSVSETPETVECSVADTGRGIAQKDLSRLFEKFTQFGRVAGAGEKGTGLGLAIVKALVELHDGTIRVESAENAGSKFIFTLPKNV